LIKYDQSSPIYFDLNEKFRISGTDSQTSYQNSKNFKNRLADWHLAIIKI